MAGGYDKGYGLLEASPGALAVIILFFLVVTLGFEHLLHFIRHELTKRKKFGLRQALDNFATEIMLLGVAILLLMAFEDKIATICTTRMPTLKPWLDSVQDCPCCLAKTKYVTDCYVQDRGCPTIKEMKENPVCKADTGLFKGLKHKSAQVNKTTKGGKSANSTKGTEYGAPPPMNDPAADQLGSDAQGHRRRSLLAPAAKEEYGANDTKGGYGKKELKCNGRFAATYDVCGGVPGKIPLVTVKTLHEVHMLLFVMACVHIVVSTIVLLVSSLKIKYYAHRCGASKEDQLASAAIAAASLRSFTMRRIDTSRFLSAQPSMKSIDVSAGLSSEGGGPGHDQEPPSAFMTAPPRAALKATNSSSSSAGGELRAIPWHGRAESLRSFKAWVVETAEQLFRQIILFRTVTKEEYSVLRASFYLTYAPILDGVKGKRIAEQLSLLYSEPGGHDHDHDHGSHGHGHDHPEEPLRPENAARSYAPYLLESVERDGAKAVGLGLPMWICVLVFVLVSSAIGWATWVFMIIAAGLLLFVNTTLLASMRHMTKGGIVRVHKEGWYRWMHRHHVLLEIIKLILFFFSFVISNAIFFSKYGPQSCFFSRAGFQGLHRAIPWWGIMLVDIALLMNVALFTLPLYSITTHTLRCNKNLFKSVVATNAEDEEWLRFKGAKHSPAHGASHGGHSGGHGGGHGAGHGAAHGVAAAADQHRIHPVFSV